MPKSEDVNSLTMEQLKELILELRKPVKTEKELREERDQESARVNMMETLKAEAANKEATKKNCSHLRSNGSTTAVYIADFGYLYCQACTKWIKPNEEPDLFNRIYQLAI